MALMSPPLKFCIHYLLSRLEENSLYWSVILLSTILLKSTLQSSVKGGIKTQPSFSFTIVKCPPTLTDTCTITHYTDHYSHNKKEVLQGSKCKLVEVPQKEDHPSPSQDLCEEVINEGLKQKICSHSSGDWKPQISTWHAQTPPEVCEKGCYCALIWLVSAPFPSLLPPLHSFPMSLLSYYLPFVHFYELCPIPIPRYF